MKQPEQRSQNKSTKSVCVCVCVPLHEWILIAVWQMEVCVKKCESKTVSVCAFVWKREVPPVYVGKALCKSVRIWIYTTLTAYTQIKSELISFSKYIVLIGNPSMKRLLIHQLLSTSVNWLHKHSCIIQNYHFWNINKLDNVILM